MAAPAVTASGFLGFGRSAYAYLLAGGLAISAYGVLAPAGSGDAVFVAIGAAAAAAVLAGIRLTRPAVRSAWLAVAAGLIFLTVGNLLTAVARGPGMAEVRNLADGMFLAAYLPLFVAAYRFGRATHRSDRTVFLDTGIVGLAAVPVIWEVIVEPNMPESIAGSAGVMALSMPLVDVLLVSLVAPLLLLRSSRTASAYLLVAALAVMGMGDSLYAIRSLQPSPQQDLLANLCWLSSYVLLGAAALVPSARDLGALRDPRRGSGDLARLAVTATALLATPVVVLVEAFGDANQDLIYYAGLSMAIAVLVIIRLQRTIAELAQVDGRFRRFMSHPSFMAEIKDAAGRYVYMNPSAEGIQRLTDDDWYGRTDAELFPRALAERRAEADAAVRRTGGSMVGNIEMDGRIWHMERFALPGSGGAVGILGLDVTDLARLGAAIDHATDGVIVTDAEDRIVYVNPAFERITGHASEDVDGLRVADVPAAAALARALAKARDDHEDGWRGDVVTRRRDGADLVCETTISPIVVEGQSGPSFVTIQRDVTRERAAERAAERRERERALMAETLSTLRAGATPEVTAASVCSQMVKVPEVAIASVITFDMDGCATVLGQVHRSGAGMPGLRLGRARSNYLRVRAEAGPWVERWSVDDEHPYRAMFAELDIRANAYAPIVVDGSPIGVLVSGSDLGDSIDQMTERLPALLEFAAITATLLAGAVADRRAADSQRAALRRIIETRAYQPVFQPIVELDTGEVRGYEALTRFADGTSPDERFEVANRVGMGLELERACLQAVFEASSRLPIGPWLNVNVSPELVLAAMVNDILPTIGRDVVLEITEHQAITDYESFRLAMAPMRDRVSLAVDDAGAGYSSLRHIVELAPAMVKLDRSLIAGIAEDGAREAVVTGMVRFAESAGHMLLAEGVETGAELAALRRLGVRLGQGYLLGRPAPIGSATEGSAASPVQRRAASARRASRGAAKQSLRPVVRLIA